MSPLPRAILACAVLAQCGAPSLRAIPQNFGGGFGGFFGLNERGPGWRAPANVEDLDDVILAAARWDQLPGEWIDHPGLHTDRFKVLATPANAFGLVPELTAARYVGSEVRSVYLQFADAGAYFGYTPRAELERESTRRALAAKQRKFRRHYDEILAYLERELPRQVGAPGVERAVGRTSVLRSEYTDFDNGEVVVRLGASEGDYIYVEVMRSGDAQHGYLAQEVAALRPHELAEHLRSTVSRAENGDTQIEGIPVFVQGTRPYCAINTLGMVVHHFGLRVPVNALAASAEIQKTGSAKGSKILEVYYAAAKEARVGFMRSNRFEFERAMRAIDAGCPVLVWRRYDADRDRLHTEFARYFEAEPGAELPRVDEAERATWPGADAPGHASIVTGYNAERGEVIFLESWGEQSRDRRMRAAEMEATAYMVFYFKP